MINILWVALFLVSAVSAFYHLIFLSDTEIINQIITSIFQNAQTAVDISLGLIGILSFWLGVLKLIETSGLANIISRKLSPFFQIIMKDIPNNSPAISTVVLNMTANFLGLDNAATPMGLKAMEQLQEYNKEKDIEFLKCNAEEHFYKISEGEFFVFFPHDAHKPAIKVDKNKNVKKVIVKVGV